MRPFVLFVLAGCSSEVGPTWTADVGPLLAERCTGCHRSGGAAPFPLETYGAARDAAPLVRSAIEDRTMPPWLMDASGACGTFARSEWLTDEQIALVGRWVDTGAPRGEGHGPPPVSPLALSHVDLSLDMAEPYVPESGIPDDYRCFPLDPGLTEDAWVAGWDVTAGAPEMVHHVIGFAMPDAASDAIARARDLADPGPGYSCLGDSGVTGVPPFLAWAPGTGATMLPEGTGIRLGAGRTLVLQVHYHPHGEPEPDLTAVKLALTGARPSEEASLVLLADIELELPPRTPDASAHFETRLLLPEGQLAVWGVFAHMHLTGRSLRVTSGEPSDERCLAEVPRWDFGWQRFYFYEAPLLLDSGERLAIECHYDTSTRDTVTRFGTGSEDEMCLAAFLTTVR